ncbi:MAG: nuclear pore complex subunit [Fluviicola sp. XM-24bin1]|nr:MAG: nuclear pore complex subunit [Fluviicola sp. XM-24bin1]
MDNLIIEGTPKTPTVEFDAAAGKIVLKGRSIPENSIEFYKPMQDWLAQYGSTPATQTVVDIRLEYFNTSSSKCILDFFKKLETIKDSGNQVTVNWYFETDDEDMQEAGEDYEAIVGLPFTIIEVDEI